MSNSNNIEQFKKMNVSAGVIYKRKNNSVLLIRRSPTDHWPLHYEFPRGKCDKPLGESLIHCLKREVKEETSLVVFPINYLGSFSYISKKYKTRSTQHNFLCYMKDESQEIKLSKEHDKYMWVDSLGLAQLLVLPESYRILSKILNVKSKIIDYPDKVLSIHEIIFKSLFR